MTFAKSRYIQVPRKRHVCAGCKKLIPEGGGHYSEAGCGGGRFNSFCLCIECKKSSGYKASVDKVIRCPKCKSREVYAGERIRGPGERIIYECLRCDRMFDGGAASSD